MPKNKSIAMVGLTLAVVLVGLLVVAFRHWPPSSSLRRWVLGLSC